MRERRDSALREREICSNRMSQLKKRMLAAQVGGRGLCHLALACAWLARARVHGVCVHRHFRSSVQPVGPKPQHPSFEGMPFLWQHITTTLSLRCFLLLVVRGQCVCEYGGEKTPDLNAFPRQPKKGGGGGRERVCVCVYVRGEGKREKCSFTDEQPSCAGWEGGQTPRTQSRRASRGSFCRWPAQRSALAGAGCVRWWGVRVDKRARHKTRGENAFLL
jgi:hypothetical protein